MKLLVIQQNLNSANTSETLDFSGKSPIDIFEFFSMMNGGFIYINYIVEESKRYACQLGVEFNVSLQEIRTVFGILLVFGNHSLPKRRLHWPAEEDFLIALVTKAMSHIRFDEIIRFLHFNCYVIALNPDLLYCIFEFLICLPSRKERGLPWPPKQQGLTRSL